MQVAVGVAGESRTLHSTCLSKTSPREDRGHIEVEPPQRGDNDDSKRSSNDHAGHELQAGTDADGDDGLAERDQDDQAVTLGEMLRRDSPSFSETEHGWTQVIDRKCQDPHPNAHIAADEGGSDKKRGADKFRRRDPEQRPAQVGVIAADSGVEDDVEYADSKKADTEDQSVLTESGRYRQRDTEQHRHRGQHREPDAAFVDVDRARQPGVAGPGPPDRSEHKQATKNSVPGRVMNQETRDLRDREDEDEVEKEFERRDRVLAAADAFRRRRLRHRQRSCQPLAGTAAPAARSGARRNYSLRSLVSAAIETEDAQDAVDAAYQAKYGSRYASIVPSIVAPEAQAATLKLVPKVDR